MEPIASLAARLALEPHPEGGFYRRWYTSAAALPAAGAAAAAPAAGAPPPPRACASSILFALPRGGTSSLHRLGSSEELWLHQGGGALTVVQVAADGAVAEARVLPGAPLVVPAGALFGAYVDGAAEEAYALVCCVVVPGFVWEDFEMPEKAALLAQFAGKPEALAAIQRLCR